MILDKDIELIDGLAIAYIKSINSLVISDLHLGYETNMAKKGIFIPKVNLNKILKDLAKAVGLKNPKQIIVVGDIKNEFSTVDQDEFNELNEIVKFCKEKKVELILIKGNHDNFIDRYSQSLKLKVFGGETMIGNYLFFHGDKLPKAPEKQPLMLISGHEHPSIGIVNSIGRTEKLRCFILGKYKGIRFLVLPAISYFASGTEINVKPKSDLLSPVLRKIDINKTHAIAIGYGSTLDFGSIANLRRLDYR